MTIEIDYYITMVSKNNELVNLKGSSLTFSAHGWWGKEQNNAAAKISVRPRKNTAEGGVWGEFRRARAASEAPPPIRSEQSRAEKLPFPFRRIFWWRAHIRKSEENFFAGSRALASDGGAERIGFFQEFLIKYVRAWLYKYTRKEKSMPRPARTSGKMRGCPVGRAGIPRGDIFQ